MQVGCGKGELRTSPELFRVDMFLVARGQSKSEAISDMIGLDEQAGVLELLGASGVTTGESRNTEWQKAGS